MEVRPGPGREFVWVGGVGESALGSISSDGPGGRQVYCFGWDEHGQPGVWRSAAGMDVAYGDLRVLSTSGLEQLSALREPYLLTRYLSPTAAPHTVRFRVATGGVD